MSCLALAARYVSEDPASRTVGEWSRYDMGRLRRWLGETQLNPPNAGEDGGPPALRLEERGFLPWVNAAGLRCINRVTGAIQPVDPATGHAVVPGPDVEPPPTYCAAACLRPLPDNDACFKCVVEALLKDPAMCPAVTGVRNERDASMVVGGTAAADTVVTKTGTSASELKDTPETRARLLDTVRSAVECTYCAAERMVAPGPEAEAAKRMYECVDGGARALPRGATGDEDFFQSPAFIVVVAGGCVVIGLLVWLVTWLVKRGKRRDEERARASLLAAQAGGVTGRAAG